MPNVLFASHSWCHTCPRASSAMCYTCSRASCASYLTSSRALRVLRTLVPHLSFALCFLVLLVLRAVCALLLLIPHLLQVFQACHFHMHLMSCSFHALCLLCFCCLSFLCFLHPGLRLMIVICHF